MDPGAARRAHDSLGLPALLSDTARRATDVQVAIYAGAGLLILLVAFAMRPAGWLAFAAFGACTGSFGAWAMASRELDERRVLGAAPKAISVALRTARFAAGVVGTAGAMLLLFLLLAAGLGTWKS